LIAVQLFFPFCFWLVLCQLAVFLHRKPTAILGREPLNTGRYSLCKDKTYESQAKMADMYRFGNRTDPNQNNIRTIKQPFTTCRTIAARLSAAHLMTVQSTAYLSNRRLPESTLLIRLSRSYCAVQSEQTHLQQPSLRYGGTCTIFSCICGQVQKQRRQIEVGPLHGI
jgi:hypothetical protein